MSIESRFFHRKEFACKCGCGFDAVDAELLGVLEDVRAHFNEPVYITSACRCREHNAYVGGGKNSQHLLGKAADIVLKNTSPSKVADYLEGKYGEKYGLGRYDTFTHVDVRDNKARW